MLDIFQHYGYERFDELLELKVIHIYDKLFLDDDLDLLYKLIDQSTVLEELHFNDNYILIYDGKLEDSIAKNTAIKLPLGLPRKLADAIAKNKTIKVLNLYDNRIDTEEVKHLADALKTNDTLQEICLSDNNIGDEGAKYIADMLAVNKTLQEIDLSNNNIGDKGTEIIATSLMGNTSIHTIKLEWLSPLGLGDYGNKNNISKDVMDRIKAILQNPKRKNAKKDTPPPNKRTRTEDTPNMPKVKSVQLDYEHTHCSICHSKFSTDTDSKDDEIRKFLPVLSASSKSCDHYFCQGCILKRQASIAEENDGKIPKWIPCMVCKTKTAFCPSEPKNHRLLIDILKKAEWVDAPQVKEEPAD